MKDKHNPALPSDVEVAKKIRDSLNEVCRLMTEASKMGLITTFQGISRPGESQPFAVQNLQICKIIVS